MSEQILHRVKSHENAMMCRNTHNERNIMPKPKMLFNTWELPNWVDEEIEVVKKYLLNEKVKIVIRWNNNIYHINQPSNKDWKAIDKPCKVIVTKFINTPKNARLRIQQPKKFTSVG